MKKLFIHHPLFRLLSPVFSGVIVYLLILLIHNNVEQLQDYFLGQELYICIGLSYIIQEFSRALLMLFKRFSNAYTSKMLTLQIIVSMLLCVIVTTLSMTLYYVVVEGYRPNANELIPFNIIFCSITLIYILLYLSHQYLQRTSTQKLAQEKSLKQHVEDDFNQFKQGINPNLLFESLESLIVLIKQNKEQTDDFIDNMASVYRYILSKRQQQLVNFNDEFSVLNNLVNLINYLPYRNVEVISNVTSRFLLVPGSLLTIIEQIIRSSIKTIDNSIKLTINEYDTDFKIHYHPNDKIAAPLNEKLFMDIEEVYKIYSENSITIVNEKHLRIISIPKLILKE